MGRGLGLGKDLVGLGEDNPGGGARVDQSILFFISFRCFFSFLLAVTKIKNKNKKAELKMSQVSALNLFSSFLSISLS